MVAAMPATAKRERAEYHRDYRKRRKLHGPPATSDMFDPWVPDAEQPERFEIPEQPADQARALADWSASTLIVPDGMLSGRPFLVDEWQISFLRDALAPDIREAGLSVARKNGKTGLIALLLLGFLVGPLHRPGWRGVVTSMTGELAKELRNAMMAISEMSGIGYWLDVRESPTPGRILGPNRTRLDFIAADKATGHGIGADIAVIDEAGLMGESLRNLFNAMLSCVSGRDGRAIYISIQADGPMFREVGERAAHRAVAWHCYQPAPECKIDDREAWEAGNPGLRSGIKSRSYMVDMSQRALASPANQATFRAYDLNLPQDPSRETICMPDQWDGCVTTLQPERTGRCVLGIDLGGSTSMTAAAAIWPENGRFEVWAALPGTPPLDKRGAADGVGNVYEMMRERGELETYPGLLTPVAQFLTGIADRLKGEQITMAGADRYRKAEAQQALIDAGINWPMVWRGQGASATADGSHDVRAFQRMVLTKWLSVVDTLLMVHAIGSSAIQRDPRGNPALDKSRSRGRIDALSAAVIAAGLAERARATTRRRYGGLLS